jgi:2,3-bisphosphoglycerate-independent phosphoglycerate mutase
MDTQQIISSLQMKNTTKIVLIVADGLGGLPLSPGGKTELETANTPHLDDLVAKNVCGLATPVLPGITPGSGPGHLALFGYDPLAHQIGRGVLETLGIDFALQKDDVAARGNFCSVDATGKITDRRAGRISTETCKKLVEKLRKITIPGVTIFVEPVRDYRFALILRGESLGGDIADTDPQIAGALPLEAKAHTTGSKKAAEIINEFISQAKEILKKDHPANMITFRGIGKRPPIASLDELHGLKAAAICVYPMYRGLARLVGMSIVPPVKNFQEQLASLKKHWELYDFFFLHFKYTDSAGEDGNFEEKVKQIEDLDSYLPEILALSPDVLVVTGDHSSPAAMKAHSFHPVPVLLASPVCRPDKVTQFGESQCIQGGLGHIASKNLMPLILAHAKRLQKFGA